MVCGLRPNPTLFILRYLNYFLLLYFISCYHVVAFVPSNIRAAIWRAKPASEQKFRRNMFSGIVEEIGEIISMEFNRSVRMWDGSMAQGLELIVRSKIATEDAYIGCSIAINGVCLTATELNDDKFTVAISPETIRRTNLGILRVGSGVNIERALQPNARNSGHFVQGHIDCTARVLDKWFEGDSLWVKLGISDEYIHYIVPKGFVSLDGTSLTICDVSSKPTESWFTIMLVPHTQQNVIFPRKKIGELVNVEVDVLGKFVEKSLSTVLNRMKVDLQRLEEQLHDKTQQIDTLSQITEQLMQRITSLERERAS